MNQQTEIEILKLEKVIAQLDISWLQRQDSFKVHDRGKDYLPVLEDAEALIGLSIFAYMGLLAFYFISKVPFSGVIIGTVFALVSIVVGFYIRSKAKYYAESKKYYEKKREGLVSQIQKLKNSA